jgi:hypothetical protein
VPERPFSIRISDELLTQIKERYPEFGSSSPTSKGNSNSDTLRELIIQGLGIDSEQAMNHQLAEVRQELRDLKSELQSVRRNFSTTLQIILRNAAKFSPQDVEATIEQLKQKGKIV